MSEPNEKTDASAGDAATEKPKRRRFRWYLQVPFWLAGYVMAFGFDTLLLRNLPLLLMTVFVFGVLHILDKGVKRRFDPPPKPRTWRLAKLILLELAVAFVFLFSVLCVMRFRVPPVAISKQTTHITSPLTVDGMEIDDIRAIEARFAPKDALKDNGFRTVVRLFGPDQVFLCDGDSEHRKEHMLQLCGQLQLDDGNGPPRLAFQEIDAFFRQQLGNRELPEEEKTEKAIREQSWSLVKKMTRKPWKPGDFPESENWLRDNAEAMDQFGEAVRMPCYYVPLPAWSQSTSFFDRCCHEANFHRNIVRSLQCRIMHSLAAGDIDKAFYDLETVLRLADLQSRHPVSVTQSFMTRAIQSTGFLCVQKILEYGDLSKERLERLREIVRRNQTVIAPRDMVFLYRLDGMNCLYLAASGRIFDIDGFVEKSTWFGQQCGKLCVAGSRYFAWNSIFSRFQENVDRLDAIADAPASRSQYLAVVAWNESMESSVFREGFSISEYLYFIFQKGIYQIFPELVGEVTVGFASTALSGGFSSHYRGLVQIRQAELAIALEAYRLDHGAFPKELGELKTDYRVGDKIVWEGDQRESRNRNARVFATHNIFAPPQYLNAIPDDPFTDGEPFRYVPAVTDGRITGYALYSIGPNGENDGGDNRYEKECDEESEPEPAEKTGDDIRIRRSLRRAALKIQNPEPGV